MKYLMKSKSFTESKTYLKTVEENKVEYKIGDYILLKNDDDSVKPEAKIIDIEDKRKFFDFDLKDAGIKVRITYDIEVFSDSNELIETFVYAEEIERFLTPKEIEEFELKLSANKYNIV